MPTTRSAQSETPTKTNQTSSIFNLEEQLLFYGQYHHNPINIIIHLICVPLIFFTTLVLVHNISSFSKTDLKSITGTIEIPEILIRTGLFGPSGTTYDLNLSTITSILYSSYFIILEPIAGLLYSPILISFGHWSNLLSSESYYGSYKDYYKVVFTVWTLAWIFQFIGHGKFEKRKPALVDNLFQSIVLAVFFVWIEALFFLGYRPKLYKSLNLKIQSAIAKFKANQSPQNKPLLNPHSKM